VTTVARAFRKGAQQQVPRLPKLLSRELEAELELTEDGKAEISALKADNDRIWPKPELGDILELKQQLEDDRTNWAAQVNNVRTARHLEDTTPEKWAKKLNLPEDRRFHSNNTGNEINRVVSMLGRNPARVTIPYTASTNVAIQRAEKQAQWAQAFLKAAERSARLPIWSRGDDAVVESGLGGFELYMTEAWEKVEKLIKERDPDVVDPDLDKQIDEALKTAGLPFAMRPIDSMALLVDPEDPDSPVLIVERKRYRNVYRRLQSKLSADEVEKLKLPRPGQRSWPDHQRLVRYSYGDTEETYEAHTAGEAGNLVEVIRYYDARWYVEVVAGRITECSEHRWPGIPVFPQFGKVTSSANSEWMLQGIVFGMLSQELAINDLVTLGLDNQYTYGRPFPVVTTSENGSNLLDKDGQPSVIRLDDPSRPPQLGPGQDVKDAFGGFAGNIDPQLLQLIQSYWQMSGLNPIAQGESPGADPSGFALNTLNTGAQALYESILDNKVKTLGNIIDFVRLAIRDTIGETVYLSVETNDHKGIEYLGLGPDDIDESPATVYIDPKSDMQKLAIISMLSTANQQGYISRRPVQVLGLTGIVEDPDDEDKQITLDNAKAMMLPQIVQSVLMQVTQDAFPELAAQPPGAPPPGGPQAGQSPDGLQQQGITPPRGTSVGNPAPKPGVAQANRGRAGQQPANQGVPALG
jgi:hypothetical protein